MKRVVLLLGATILALACEQLDPSNNNGGDNGNQNGGGKSTVQIQISSKAEFNMASDKDTVFVYFSAVDEKYNPVDWTAITSAEWCSVNTASGSGNGEFKIMVADNPTASVRTADVTIKAGDNSAIVKIIQSLNAGAMAAEPWFSKNYWERTDREKAGLRGPVKSWHEVHYTSFHKYYYDEAGRLVKDEFHDTDKNEIGYTWTYEYDAQGHLVRYTDGNVLFTLEYNNPGKFVATSAYNWIPIYVSGKDYPLTIMKDLSAIHYLDDIPGYYEQNDITYTFGEDGNLTITEAFRRDRFGEASITTYHLTYSGGYPVAHEAVGITATYADNGMPLMLSENGGGVLHTFVANDKQLLVKDFKEPQASGMFPTLWYEYTYNSNFDQTVYHRAMFSNDTDYTDTFSKYHYDSHGNWIQRQEVTEPATQRGQFFTSIVGREIEYY